MNWLGNNKPTFLHGWPDDKEHVKYIKCVHEYSAITNRGSHGFDRMVVGFTTTYAITISAYHH